MAIEVKVFDEIYTFETVHKAEVFISDLINKYFANDHIGQAEIEVKATGEDAAKKDAPSVLEVGIVEVVKSKDVGPGQPRQ